jgi:hypothetical protein
MTRSRSAAVPGMGSRPRDIRTHCSKIAAVGGGIRTGDVRGRSGGGVESAIEADNLSADLRRNVEVAGFACGLRDLF